MKNVSVGQSVEVAVKAWLRHHQRMLEVPNCRGFLERGLLEFRTGKGHPAAPEPLVKGVWVVAGVERNDAMWLAGGAVARLVTRNADEPGTGGLGYEDALALARAGASVVLAGRSAAKGAEAVARIRATIPAADVRFEALDLASFASVADFACCMASRHAIIDLLINNAGVMVPPRRGVTADGFELQFGTNYLGHFALTARLMPLLREGARVISLSSVAARSGAIDFDDLNSDRGYRPMAAYSQSKLACLMFALELQRRSDLQGWGIGSIASHPGVARTDLLHNGPGRRSAHGIVRTMLPFLFQPAERGALPTLFAATSPNAVGGAYYGPDGVAEIRGYPTRAQVPPQALDQDAASRLWHVSEELAGVTFSLDRSRSRAAWERAGDISRAVNLRSTEEQ